LELPRRRFLGRTLSHEGGDILLVSSYEHRAGPIDLVPIARALSAAFIINHITNQSHLTIIVIQTTSNHHRPLNALRRPRRSPQYETPARAAVNRRCR